MATEGRADERRRRELAALLRRLAANAEMAAERVETAEGTRMRREGAMGMSA